MCSFTFNDKIFIEYPEKTITTTKQRRKNTQIYMHDHIGLFNSQNLILFLKKTNALFV